ncbi:FixH family protein [Streptomyces sp. NPDC048200]|uniref:FixH family protein n=1 Tax=Streptomyces sp. NPDC048200 TaxID=3365512 RepID=UPI00371C7EC3
MNRRTATAQPAAPRTPAPLPALSRTPAVRRSALLAAAVLAIAALSGCNSGADTAANSGSAKGASCNPTKTNAGLKITLTATPCPLQGGKTGTAAITVKDSDGKAVDGAKVEVNPEMASMKMKGGDQTAAAKGDGYEAKLVLGMSGDWKVTVTVTPSTGQKATATFDLTAK